MALNPEISFTWLGHGTWKARSAKHKEILIDPWVMNNPVTPANLKTVDKCDLMLIPHAHFDHIGDALEIAKMTNPKIVTIAELGTWLGSKGVAGDSIIAGNKGGTIDVDGIKVTLVHAEHSCGISDNGQILYGGEPSGAVIPLSDRETPYFFSGTPPPPLARPSPAAPSPASPPSPGSPPPHQ